MIFKDYKGIKIIAMANWVDSYHGWRFETHLNTPRTLKYFKPRGTYPLTQTSKYIEGTLQRIKRALDDGIPIAESYAQKEMDKQEKINEQTRKTQKLSEALGVSIHHNQYSGISMYQYGNINCGAFSMSFSNSSREPEMFIVDRLKGRYTSEEIKKIIQIVGSNPRAIAQRLTNT